ncbi:MAG: tetratricopeptide repeat protein [Candidatus Lernaella stagnicola]|nr:tetratricopeptide repeat protein [Candidatus Lernaella stagnicola]
MRLVRNLVIVLVAFSMIAASCGKKRVGEDDARKAQGYYEMAVASMYHGDPTSALGDLQTALTYNPNDPEIYHALGIVYYSKEKYGKAVSNFKKAIELQPDHSDSHHNLGHLYLTQGRYEIAIKEFHSALENDLYRNRAQSLNALGYAYFKRRDYLEAEKFLKECIDHDRLYFTAYDNLAKVYIALERYDDAREILERGLEIRPVFPEAMLDLAMVVCKQGDKKRGLDLLKRIKQMDPYGEFGARADEYKMLCE